MAPQLTLRRTILTAGGGRPDEDDFEGFDAGRSVGRILLTPAANPATPWFWTITAHCPQPPTSRGYAASREEAMAACKSAWLR